MKKVDIFPIKPRLLFELKPPFKSAVGNYVKRIIENNRRLSLLYRWSSVIKLGFSLDK